MFVLIGLRDMFGIAKKSRNCKVLQELGNQNCSLPPILIFSSLIFSNVIELNRFRCTVISVYSDEGLTFETSAIQQTSQAKKIYNINRC